MKRNSKRTIQSGGHFPDDPLVPSVILTEALAQTAGIAAASGYPETSRPRFLLSAIRQMKFFQAVRREEPIRLRARTVGQSGRTIAIRSGSFERRDVGGGGSTRAECSPGAGLESLRWRRRLAWNCRSFQIVNGTPGSRSGQRRCFLPRPLARGVVSLFFPPPENVSDLKRSG